MFTCPCCGFKTLDEAFAYDICEICGWEDDPTQQDYPGLDFGPNEGSLCEEQAELLKRIPAERTSYNGYVRDKEWRPLLADECLNPEAAIETGLDYFNLIGEEEMVYYWKRKK